ncbi:MAG: ABC transporter permease [Athalassotoga sp.]|uniref:ABC transporter permease n=1 Tax=Athalassotoga sp. TaxID=2022597 RepID=UPI003D02CFFE
MKTFIGKSFRMFIRDRQAVLMFFVLPILLMLILGFVIEGLSGSTTGVNVKIAAFSSSSAIQNAMTKASSGTGIEFVFAKSVDDLNDLLNSGKVQMGIIFDKDVFTFVYNQSFGQYNNYLKILQDVISSSVVNALSNVKPYIQIKSLSVKSGNLTVIGFIVPGVVAIAITIAGIFGMAIIAGNYRQNMVLKRLEVTPLNGGLFFFSLAIVRFIASLIAASVTVVLSEIIFSTSYSINWPAFLIFISGGVILSLGIGVIFALLSRDLWTILNISTILSITMMLFSDVFFPYSIMPPYMRIISEMLPISYFSQGLRYTLGIEAMHYQDFVILTAVFIAGGLAMIFFGGMEILKLERK